MVSPIPSRYPRVSPYLCVSDCDAAIQFYSEVFGFEERMRIPLPGGTIGHAELALGDGVVMMSDEFPDMGVLGPKSVGGTPVTVCIYVENVDAVHRAALEAGAKEVRGPEDQFHGDRSSKLEDPFGHVWSIATRIEDVSAEEVAERAKKMFGG
jgi:PhnB protein